MKILDCTLRDGGYYNDWDFESDLVESYLSAVRNSRIDMVELGLRNFKSSGFKGASFYTTESYLNRITLPEGPSYGVMVDAKTILGRSSDVEKTVKDLFVSSQDSKLDFVRLACHFNELNGAGIAVQTLSELGYEVYVNLMQISQRSGSEIEEAARQVQSWGVVKALYFADSLGNLTPTDIKELVAYIERGWSGDLGFHAHNNMGLALINALAAIDNGVVYVDATVSGMGRGAGNVETEVLIAELSARGSSRYSEEYLANILTHSFIPMKAEYQWGPCLHYYLAARYNIHPSYVQKLLTDSHYGPAERAAAITHLKKLAGKTSYDERLLERLFSLEGSQLNDESFNGINTISLRGTRVGVLIGAGESIKRYLPEIRRFVNESSSKVFAINNPLHEMRDLIDFHILSHNKKHIDYNEFLSDVSIPVIMPASRLTSCEKDSLSTENIVNYGLNIEWNKFEVGIDSAVVPCDLTVAYGIAVLIRLGVTKIYMAGFDGYPLDDLRQKEMADFIYSVRTERPEISFEAITPTTYPIDQGSIYAPFL